MWKCEFELTHQTDPKFHSLFSWLVLKLPLILFLLGINHILSLSNYEKCNKNYCVIRLIDL